MAAKTYAQLYQDALQQVDEVVGSGATTAKQIIQAGINESYSEAAGLRNWETLQSNVAVSTASGTASYTPITSSSSTPRIRRIISVLDETNKKLIQEIDQRIFEKSYPFVDPTLTNNQGNPRVWMTSDYTTNRDVTIKLYPIPNAVATLRVRYFFEPLPLTNDTDIPLIPDQFHYGLSYWAIAKYYEYQREFVSNYYRQQHQQWISDMLAAEYGPVIEAPQMNPLTRNQSYVVGKIGRIYN